MSTEFKKVPAIEKCFAILNLIATSNASLGISDISNQLDLNKSTVFNIAYTLKALDILEQSADGKFKFGTALYLLGKVSGKSSDLIQTVHPFLEKINRETKLSAFLGIRSGTHAVILDKVDTAFDIKISSEIGMRLPLMAGAGGKALLCQLTEEEIDNILKATALKPFTRKTSTDRKVFKKNVLKIKEDGVAFDDEEYIEGIVAFAVPLKAYPQDLQAAIWAAGLKQQVGTEEVPRISAFMKKIAADVNLRFSGTQVAAERPVN